MERPLCLIVNPAAGNGRSLRLLPHATGVLQAAGADHRVVESTSLGHAQELAAQAAERGDAVIAVGGDGLVGALAGIAAAGGRFTRYPEPGAIAGAGATYGIIPAGRGNDLARVLGIPSDPREAARVVAGGRHRQVDLIGVGMPGQPETVVAGSVYAGIPAVAGDLANASRLPGWLVYNVAALRAVARWKPVRFTVSVIMPEPVTGSADAGRTETGPEDSDQEDSGPVSLVSRSKISRHDFDGYAVIIASNPYFGAGMQVAPPALIDDGILDIVLMRQAPKLTFVRALLKIKDGSHVALPQVELTRGVTAVLTMSRSLPVAADGEPLACASPLAAGASLEIRVLPGALRVLVPAD